MEFYKTHSEIYCTTPCVTTTRSRRISGGTRLADKFVGAVIGEEKERFPRGNRMFRFDRCDDGMGTVFASRGATKFIDKTPEMFDVPSVAGFRHLF